MKNNVILTGTGLYSEVFNPGYQLVNFDFSSILNNLSSLLWADKVILTTTAKLYFQRNLSSSNSKMERIQNWLEMTTFDVCNKHNVFEYREIPVMEGTFLEEIEKNVENQIKLISKSEILKVQKSNLPGGVKVGQHNYCLPRILSFYSALLLAKTWDAQILATQDFHNYFHAAGSCFLEDIRTQRAQYDAFSDIIACKIPSFSAQIRVGEKDCWSCETGQTCDSSDLVKYKKQSAFY